MTRGGLDVTIVKVALPAIGREIGGSLAGLQWVIDAYTLALASIMLTAGGTADRVGARRVFVLGLTTFAIGSAACAAAPALGVLIAARAVQDLGAFFVRAQRRPSAMLPLDLFRSRAFSGATAVGLLFNLASGRLTARYGPRPPMIAGLLLAAAGVAVLATTGTGPPATPLWLVVGGGSVLLGLVSLAMPAMTAVVVGAAGPEHAGVASGVLNAVRQSGGALGVGPARLAAWQRLGPRSEPARPAGGRDRRVPDRGGPGLVHHPPRSGAFTSPGSARDRGCRRRSRRRRCPGTAAA